MDAKTLLALAATVFFWASAFVGIRVGLQAYSPDALALLRYLIAAVAIVPVYFMQRGRQSLRLVDVPRFLVVGITGFTIYNVALNRSELTITAATASFIIGLMPIFTILLAILFLKEPFSRRGWLGVVISVIGVLLITLGEHGGIHLNGGVVYALIAALAGGIYTVSQKPLFCRYSALQVGAIAIWVGTFFLLYAAPQLYQQMKTASYHATLATVYIGLFPGVIAYSCWSYVLSRVTTAQAATYLYSLPVVTTLIGYCYLDEVPALYSLVGGVIALLGAYVASRRGQRQSKIVLKSS